MISWKFDWNWRKSQGSGCITLKEVENVSDKIKDFRFLVLAVTKSM